MENPRPFDDHRVITYPDGTQAIFGTIEMTYFGTIKHVRQANAVDLPPFVDTPVVSAYIFCVDWDMNPHRLKEKDFVFYQADYNAKNRLIKFTAQNIWGEINSDYKFVCNYVITGKVAPVKTRP